jgi:O-antigen/teichoic acid export membrane protein
VNKIVKGTFIYTLGSLLPKIGAFIFLPIYLEYLAPEEYGIVSSLLIVNTVLITIYSLSLPRALYRIYYDYKETGDRKVLIGTIIITVAVIAAALLGLTCLFGDIFRRIYESIPFYPFFFYSTLTCFFLVLQEIPAIVLRIEERPAAFVSVNVSMFFVKSAIILLFVVWMGKGATGYLQADLIGTALFCPVYYFMIRKNITWKWRWDVCKNALLFSLPILPGMLASWVLNLSDRIFIEHYFSTREVGVYSLGYQIAGLILIFSLAFRSAYDPYFYRIANSEDQGAARKKLYKTNHVFLLVILLSCFSIAFFAKEGIVLFFDDRYKEAHRIIPIISLAYLLSQANGLLNVMIYQQKKTKIVMYITLVSSAMSIALNFLLIPLIGIYGAAWSTVLSFFLVFLSTYYYARKTYFIPFNWMQLGTVGILLAIVFALFYLIGFENIYLSLILKLLSLAAIALVFFYRYKETFYTIVRRK